MKTNENSQLKESIYMHSHGIKEFEYIKVDIENRNDSWKRFCLLVNDPEHRAQLIHHAITATVSYVLYNVSDEHFIMRIVWFNSRVQF